MFNSLCIGMTNTIPISMIYATTFYQNKQIKIRIRITRNVPCCLLEQVENKISNFRNVKVNKTNKLLKNTINGGYYVISLGNNYERHMFFIHRLVANAFLFNNKIRNNNS